MVDRKLQIEVELDADGAVRGIRNLDDAIDRTKNTTETASGSFTRFQASIVTINQAVELAGRAFDGLSRVAGFAIEQLARGQEVDGITRSFEGLQQSIGNLADDKLESLQTATRGTISQLELMRIANEAVLLGVDKGEGQFADLAEAAIRLGKSVGQDANEALRTVNEAIGRNSFELLNNLGINLRVSEAQELYAAQLGKTTAQLSEQEKQEAFSVIAKQKVIEASQKVGEVQDNAAEAANRLQAQTSDLVDQFSLAIAENADLADGLDDLGDELENIDVQALAEAFVNLIGVMADVAKAAVAAGNAISRGFNFALGQVDRTALFFELGSSAAEAAEEVEDLTESLAPTAENLEAVAQQTQRVIDAANENLPITRATAEAVKTVEGRYQEFKDRVDASSDALRDSLTPIDQAKQSAQVLADNIGNVADSAQRSTDAIRVTADTLQLEAPNIISASRKIGDDSGDEAGGAFATQFTTVVSQAVSGGDFGSTIGSTLGTAIGGAVAGPIGSAIGSALGDRLGTELQDEFRSNLKTALEGGSDGAGAAGFLAIDSIFPGLGSGLSSVFGSAFGGNTNAAANAREGFFNFIQEALDANGAEAVIEGELTELSSLFTNISRDIFDPGGGGFDELFSLSPDVQASFLGVGEAITQVLQSTGEFTELVGGQVSAVLADKLGGDLNALQILVSQLGLSFEELEGAMVSAAQKGEISFLDAQTGLQKLGQIAEEGIPGQIGAIDTAFDNMKKAGVQGGAATIDALKDIGAEAVELGINTIPELEQALINSGVAADDVAKFMEALAETGITSVSALASATDREAIQTLADLQSQSFAFEETFNQSVDRVIERLERIPDETTTTVKVRVETEAIDSTAQQLVDSGGLGLQ